MGSPEEQRAFVHRLVRALGPELLPEEKAMLTSLVERDSAIHVHAALPRVVPDGTTRWLRHLYATPEKKEEENG